MRAAVVTAMNGPWEVQNVPEPKPGPNQVLVKMHASGVCYTDVHETLGHLPGAFPRILGHEPVGEIVSVGPGVRTRRVGDRVGVAWVQATCGRCEWCLRGREHFAPTRQGFNFRVDTRNSCPCTPRQQLCCPRACRTNKRRQFSAPATLYGAASVGRIPNRTSVSLSWVLAGSGISRFNMQRQRDSRRLQSPTRPIKTK